MAYYSNALDAATMLRSSRYTRYGNVMDGGGAIKTRSAQLVFLQRKQNKKKKNKNPNSGSRESPLEGGKKVETRGGTGKFANGANGQ